MSSVGCFWEARPQQRRAGQHSPIQATFGGPHHRAVLRPLAARPIRSHNLTEPRRALTSAASRQRDQTHRAGTACPSSPATTGAETSDLGPVHLTRLNRPPPPHPHRAHRHGAGVGSGTRRIVVGLREPRSHGADLGPDHRLTRSVYARGAPSHTRHPRRRGSHHRGRRTRPLHPLDR